MKINHQIGIIHNILCCVYYIILKYIIDIFFYNLLQKISENTFRVTPYNNIFTFKIYNT